MSEKLIPSTPLALAWGVPRIDTAAAYPLPALREVI